MHGWAKVEVIVIRGGLHDESFLPRPSTQSMSSHLKRIAFAGTDARTDIRV